MSVLKKKPFILVAGVVFAVVLVFSIVFSSKTVDEPCDWCKGRPSVEYELKDGGVSYVCKDCSKVCAWCGEKADRHYENLAGMMVFVCDDCYED